jgi:F0F1-type ATP synthase assembly protein I
MKKRFKRFMKENGKAILKGLLIAIVTIVAFEVLHDIATSQRGYEAIGGEVFAWFIPFFVALFMVRKEEKEAEEGDC